MFRLARFIVSCFILGIVIWFAVTVPIGNHTLWGHLRRIASTPEAKDLATGAKQVAKEAVERAQREVQDNGTGSANKPQSPQPAQ
jgi:hypothetical protein